MTFVLFRSKELLDFLDEQSKKRNGFVLKLENNEKPDKDSDRIIVFVFDDLDNPQAEKHYYVLPAARAGRLIGMKTFCSSHGWSHVYLCIDNSWYTLEEVKEGLKLLLNNQS